MAKKTSIKKTRIKKTRTPPSVGMVFEKTFKWKTYKMQVVEHNGSIGYRVLGKVYRSPTGAAKAITKTEVNGWNFWDIT
jgi:hypothetical protein